MPDFAEPLALLIQEVKRLPGIGQKSAQRIAFYILRARREDVERLAQSLLDVKDKLGICTVCNNISDSELCQYCRDSSRDQSVICIVEEPHSIGNAAQLAAKNFVGSSNGCSQSTVQTRKLARNHSGTGLGRNPFWTADAAT